MNLRTKIDFGFAATAIIAGLLLYVNFQSVNYVKESSDLVKKTNEFLYNLENLENSITRVEAASRGFIISENTSFLDNLEIAKIDALNNFEAITSLHHDRHEHEDHFVQLENLINEKITHSEYGIELRKNEGVQAAIQFVSSGNGKMVMEEITDIIKLIEKEEFDLLGTAINENKTHAVNQNNAYKILATTVFLIIFFFHLHIRKSTFKVISYKEKQASLIKELNHQNKQLDDLLHIISHNVRSPANNITSLVSLLKNESNYDDCRFILDKLNKVSSGLNETLDELIEVVQIKQNVGVIKENLSFQDVCNRVIDSLQGDILVRNATISSDFSELPTLKYPKTYLESIIHNLLSNSLKYSSPDRKPQINISTHKINGKAILKVSDNGLGMDLKRIGDKIFGLRKTFHTTVNSKGIGLFMTKTHVEALGGEIGVESEVNKGTTFTVTFEKEATQNEIKSKVKSEEIQWV